MTKTNIKSDSIQNFIFENQPARGCIIHLNNSITEILNKHDYPIIIQNLIAESIVSTLFLFSICKTKGRLTLQMIGEGELKLLSVRANTEGQIRALAQYDKDKINAKTKIKDLTDILRLGRLSVTFEPEHSKDNAYRFQSMIPVLEGSVANAMESYFNLSVQNPAKIIIQSDIKKDNKKDNKQNKTPKISAFILQYLPPASNSSNKNNKNNLNSLSKDELLEKFNELSILAESLRPDEINNTDNKVLLKKLYHNEDITIFNSKELSFYCGCSKDKMQSAIISAGKEEALAILEEQKTPDQNSEAELVVTCEFCLKHYSFNRQDVENLFIEH